MNRAVTFTRGLESLLVESTPTAGSGTLVRMLASSVNPSDINKIQGTYAYLGDKPQGRVVGGTEGVGRLADGRLVLVRNSTWQKQVRAAEEDLILLPEMDVLSAATLSVNPATAFRLIADYCKSGDSLLVNAGSSHLSSCLLQMARLCDIKTTAVIRSEEARSRLEGYGATVVLEDQLRSHSVHATVAINSVGGKSATNLARQLAPGGTLITVGGMSKEPVVLPTSLLIFNDVVARGFWMTRWYANHSYQDRVKMITDIAGMITSGSLVLPSRHVVDLEESLDFIRSKSSGVIKCNDF